MPASTSHPDAPTTPAPVRHGVAECLMLADVSRGLFGDLHDRISAEQQQDACVDGGVAARPLERAEHEL